MRLKNRLFHKLIETLAAEARAGLRALEQQSRVAGFAELLAQLTPVGV